VANKHVIIDDDGGLWFGFIVKIGKGEMKKQMAVKLREVTMKEG